MFITVFITPAPKKLTARAPIKSAAAARQTAFFKSKLRDATQEAMALGASVHPFTNATESVINTVTKIGNSSEIKEIKLVNVIKCPQKTPSEESVLCSFI